MCVVRVLYCVLGVEMCASLWVAELADVWQWEVRCYSVQGIGDPMASKKCHAIKHSVV